MKSFLSIIFIIPALAYANDDFLVDDSRSLDPYISSNNSNSNQAVDDSESAGETDLGDTASFNVTKQGGLDGTNDVQGQGSKVNFQGLAMAAMFSRQCHPTHNPMACAAAAMSAADALTGSAAKQAAFQTGTNFDPSLGLKGGGSDPVIDAQLKDIIDDLNSKGYSLNEDGSVTTPDGQTVTAEELGDLEALQAKGLSASEAQAFLSQMESVKKAAAEKAGVDPEEQERGIASTDSATSFGSVDSSSEGAAVSAADTIIEEIQYKGRKKKANKLSSKEAATLSKSFNGDPIGIGMANLFLIVHQKYREKIDKKNEFIRKEY